jgi:myo-inositol-1(or 4)-monophosphatase
MNHSSQSGTFAPAGMGALLKAVIAAVKLVTAEEIMPRYLKVSHQHKSDGSLCTEADISAQSALCNKLQAILNAPVKK